VLLKREIKTIGEGELEGSGEEDEEVSVATSGLSRVYETEEVEVVAKLFGLSSSSLKKARRRLTLGQSLSSRPSYPSFPPPGTHLRTILDPSE